MSPLEIKILALALIGVAWAVAKFLFRGMRMHAWMNLVDALRVHDPELYRETGDPKYFLLQKVGRPNSLGNDRLHFHALRYPQLFATHPAIQKACAAYRRLAIIEYAYTGCIMAVALILLLTRPLWD